MRKSLKILGGATLIGFGLLCSPIAFVGDAQIAQQGKSQRPEKADEIHSLVEEQKGLGSMEVPGPDGRKDKIYYSITTPEEEMRSRQEEKEKEEKSWDMLKNIIIDPRSKIRR